MKETAVVFSLVDIAHIEGVIGRRKTQFRKQMKPQPSEFWTPFHYGDVHKMKNGEFVLFRGEPVVTGWGPSNQDGDEAYPCPYGKPGDRIWVKERWKDLEPLGEPGNLTRVSYEAVEEDPEIRKLGAWLPAVTMARWASRITLEITEIRVERLQDITHEDSNREGYDDRGVFYNGWEHDNGTDSLCQNPWVWVVSFRRIENV